MILRLKRRNALVLFFIVCGFKLSAQPYAPPAGQVGTSAMYKDSSAFVNWATGCHVIRGYQDLSNTSLGLATVGDSSMATAKAQVNGVVSLGDRGAAICTFQNPVKDGPGPDFAVFENGFNDTFLELAFVEVSSDGINFVRFPSHSLLDTTTQFGNAAVMDATKINNLAGKYRAGYGTPFDLQELAGKPNLNINAITHIKIIDVVGSLMKIYASYDSYGNKINDPWPTAFPSGGFDLDAVGVIHENTVTGIRTHQLESLVSVSPNPVCLGQNIAIATNLKIRSINLLDCAGKTISISEENELELSNVNPGIYILKIATDVGILYKKLILTR